MQHKEWQELIPFYVAQTLPTDEIRRFEAHLLTCDSCQSEIDDWRTIASAVWREADDVARSLPPLSQEVYNRLNYRDRVPASRFSANPPAAQTVESEKIRQLPQKKRGSLPLTLVAGIVVAVMFGGLLMILALRGNQDDPREIALDSTANADLTQAFAMGIGGAADATATPEGIGTPNIGIIPTLDPALPTGPPIFLTNTPAPGISPTIDKPLPTEAPVMPTPQAQITRGTLDTASMMAVDTATPDATLTPEVAPLGGGPYITVTPGTFANGLPLCEAYNPTTIPLETYEQADRNSELVAIIFPDQVVTVIMTSTTGWYLLSFDDGVQGWLQASFAYLRGNCVNSLPLATVVPSPTQIIATPTIQMEIPTSNTIAVVNASFADLYQGPSFDAAVVGVAQRNDQFPVDGYQGTGSNRWALVRLNDGSQVWIWASILTEYPAGSAPPTSTP